MFLLSATTNATIIVTNLLIIMNQREFLLTPARLERPEMQRSAKQQRIITKTRKWSTS